MMANSKTAISLLMLLANLLLWPRISECGVRPNIVIYLLDDLGWNDVSFNGAEFSTPNIDHLAGHSLRLKRYYTPSTCSPSRAALMTGRYPHRMGLAHTIITNGFDIGVPLGYDLLSDELQEVGYATHMVGKWDLGMSHWRNTPTFRGFDTFLGYYGARQDYYTHSTHAAVGIVEKSANLPYQGLDLRNQTAALTSKAGVYGPELFTEAATKVIQDHDYTRKPLFLYFANQAVHMPLQAPERYVNACSSISPNQRRMMCAKVKVADDNLGSVVNALKSTGQWDNTVLVVITDNGGQTAAGSSNWPFRGGKATVYEGGVHGVGFIHGPAIGIPTNKDFDGLVHTVDWFPTLVSGVAGKSRLEYMKAKGANGRGLPDIDGYNLIESFRGREQHPRNEVLLSLDPPFKLDHPWYQPYWPGQVAIITGWWKLIIGTALCTCEITPPVHSATGSERCDDGWFRPNGTYIAPPDQQSWTQLFHLAHDPHEKVNVARVYTRYLTALRPRLRQLARGSPRQVLPNFNRLANPAYFGGVWTPWLGA